MYTYFFYRYAEIQKKNVESGREIFSNELDENLRIISQQYPGICLPGQYEEIENVKLNIKAQKEKLDLLGRQDAIIRDLIKQNE